MTEQPKEKQRNEDYCKVCGQDCDEDPKKCCSHIVWSAKWK